MLIFHEDRDIILNKISASKNDKKEYCFVIGEPLYMQLVNQIKRNIKDGTLKPGDMLPSESQLATEYEVSRTTVRKGLSLLFTEGYINPVAGKGYFVKEPKVDQYTLYFNERKCIDNYTNETKLLGVKLVNTNAELSREFGPKPRSFVMIQWIIYSDGKPVAYDIKYLPYGKGEPTVEKEIHYATFPEVVAKHQSLFSIKKELKISAPKVTPELKEILHLSGEDPVILIKQKIFDLHHKPIGYGKLFIKGEHCNLMAVSSYNMS